MNRSSYDNQFECLGCQWVYNTKLNSDGSIERLKSCLVAKRYTQVFNIDSDETFIPIIKTTTIRVVLTISVMKNGSLCNMMLRMPFEMEFLDLLVLKHLIMFAYLNSIGF